jgi:flagellar capping protein FliD
VNPNVLTAAISAGAAVVTAVVALVLNQRGFTAIENRINSMENRINTMDSRLSQELRDVRADLKQFFQIQTDFDKRLSRIEDKLNLPPK